MQGALALLRLKSPTSDARGEPCTLEKIRAAWQRCRGRCKGTVKTASRSSGNGYLFTLTEFKLINNEFTIIVTTKQTVKILTNYADLCFILK